MTVWSGGLAPSLCWIRLLRSHFLYLPGLAALVVVPAVAGPVAFGAFGQEPQHSGGQLAVLLIAPTAVAVPVRAQCALEQ